MTVRDYHDFSHLDTPKWKRDQLFIGDWYINGVECLECGWFIRSRNKHDMVTCRCEGQAVDGGSHYLRRSGDPGMRKEVSVMFNDVEVEDET